MQGPSTQDRLEIYELYARYSWALDTGDTDGYVALFTTDAVVTEETRDRGSRCGKGHDEIRKLVMKFHYSRGFPRASASDGAVRASIRIRRACRITGWCARMPGRRSIIRRSRRTCTGAGTSGMSWRRSTACGRSAPRASWVGQGKCCRASTLAPPSREAQRRVSGGADGAAQSQFRDRAVRSECAQLSDAVHSAGIEVE